MLDRCLQHSRVRLGLFFCKRRLLQLVTVRLQHLPTHIYIDEDTCIEGGQNTTSGSMLCLRTRMYIYEDTYVEGGAIYWTLGAYVQHLLIP
jgi:hypothetical protein